MEDQSLLRKNPEIVNGREIKALVTHGEGIAALCSDNTIWRLFCGDAEYFWRPLPPIPTILEVENKLHHPTRRSTDWIMVGKAFGP